MGNANGPYTAESDLAGVAIDLADPDSVFCASLAAQTSAAFTIRIWIEGQASDCLSRNANQEAAIDLVFGTLDNYSAE